VAAELGGASEEDLLGEVVPLEVVEPLVVSVGDLEAEGFGHLHVVADVASDMEIVGNFSVHGRFDKVLVRSFFPFMVESGMELDRAHLGELNLSREDLVEGFLS
jgi:hypothetical protein